MTSNFGGAHTRSEPGAGTHNSSAVPAPGTPTRITCLDVQLGWAHNVDHHDPQHGVTLMEAHKRIHQALLEGDEARAKVYAAYVAREVRKAQEDAFGPRRLG